MNKNPSPKPTFPCHMWTTSNTPIPRPTLLTTQNGIQLQSAGFFTAHLPDRQTDRPTNRQTEWSRGQTCKNTRLHSIVLTESDVANNNCKIVLSYSIVSYSEQNQFFVRSNFRGCQRLTVNFWRTLLTTSSVKADFNRKTHCLVPTWTKARSGSCLLCQASAKTDRVFRTSPCFAMASTSSAGTSAISRFRLPL